jgi:hypothetical protein
MLLLKDSSGREFRLSSGKHNRLQVAVVTQFAPRFAPGAKLLYLGGPANTPLIMESKELARLRFSVVKYNQLSDLVLYESKKRWLYLIEVVTSHGPVTPKRYRELETAFSASWVKRKYVSVFPNFKEYGRHGHKIAWNTDAWIAEAPDHLIHYNGDKFIGPRQSPPPKRKAK